MLAHSLSGAAIQLQGARKLADREHATPRLSDAIDRARELVKVGLANARQAVGALRGDALPTVAQLPSLIDSYKADMNLDVTLRIEGEARPLPADPSLALYRGAQEALTNVMAGQTHFDPAVQQRLVSAILEQTPPTPAAEPTPASPPHLPDELTHREIEVLMLIAAGLSNSEIADKLVLSNATVKTHINRIFYKTGARDRAQAVRYAYQHGLT